METGISDYHLLVYTMLKTTYDKLPTKVIKYRQWKHFDQDIFKLKLGSLLNRNNYTNATEYRNFEKSFVSTLDKHASFKTKFLRGNNQPFMNKNLRKAIMLRSKLKNKAGCTNRPDDIAHFKKQRNFVVKLTRKTEKYFLLTL